MAISDTKITCDMFDMESLLLYMLKKHKISEAPEKTEYFTKHYQVVIPIGNDNTACLTIDEDSFEELKKRIQK